MLEDEIFKNCIPDFEKLLSYGFSFLEEFYKLSKKICDGTFLIEILIYKDGKVKGNVYDLEMGEEYLGFRVSSALGFASSIQNQFEELLIDIQKKCFIKQKFISDQANRICQKINEKYGDNPYFEWESTPHSGVFKNKDSKKWYALIMNINQEKLNAGKEMVDIINLKVDKNKIDSLLKLNGYFPAYHMNKKFWISIVLDETISDQDILKLIEESYQYADRASVKRADGEWIIPANPKYYNIIEGFNKHEVLTWNQSAGIRVGDIVYIYVGAPISAILFKCTVVKNNIPNENGNKKRIMEIRIIEKYNQNLCSFSKMKEHGVYAVRGPRFMPCSLKEYIYQKQGEIYDNGSN